jgi:hypothetical protein
MLSFRIREGKIFPDEDRLGSFKEPISIKHTINYIRLLDISDTL